MQSKIKETINKILWKVNLRISKPFPRAFQKYNLKFRVEDSDWWLNKP